MVGAARHADQQGLRRRGFVERFCDHGRRRGARPAERHDQITDGETGLLVEPDDAPAMADALRRLVEDDALATRLADQARRHALDHFSPARYQREVVAVLAGLVARSKRR